MNLSYAKTRADHPTFVIRNSLSRAHRFATPCGTPPVAPASSPVLEHDLTVDDDVEDAFGVLVRLRVRRRVSLTPAGSKTAISAFRPEHTTIRQSETGSGNAVILRTASSSVGRCFSRTYTPSTRTNVP